MAVAALIVATGCSLGADEEPQPATGAPAEIAGVVERLERATGERDWATVCDDLFTTAAHERAGGADCARRLARSGDEIERPTVEIRAITLRGERATVRVRSTAEGRRAVVESLELRRGPDGWRVEGLAG